jgi:hypothetical protein
MAVLTPAARPRTAPVDVIFLPLPSGFRPADATLARRPAGGAGPVAGSARPPRRASRAGRDRRGLAGIVAASVCAVLAGSRSFAAIAQWTAELAGSDPGDLARLGLTRSSAPDEPAFRRVLSRLDATVLDALIGAFMWTRTPLVHGRRVIAIDGKATRGARTK